jgi:hypothetical protein
MELSTRLQCKGITAGAIRALIHDSEFQTIRDGNSQLVFLKVFSKTATNGKCLRKGEVLDEVE